MEYALFIYLASRVDVIILICTTSVAILSTLLLFCILEILERRENENLKKLRNRYIKAIAAFLTVIILLPTSSQIKYIVAGYVLDSASSDVKRVARKCSAGYWDIPAAVFSLHSRQIRKARASNLCEALKMLQGFAFNEVEEIRADFHA